MNSAVNMATVAKGPGFFRKVWMNTKDKVAAAGRDYKESFRLTVNDARESPGRTALWYVRKYSVTSCCHHEHEHGDTSDTA